MAELDCYPWSGHAVIMGNRQMEGEAVEEVLGYFGKRKNLSRKKYRQFVADGSAQGRRNDLIGGGLRRSQGGTEEGRRLESYDDRVLASGEFVEYLRNYKKLNGKLAKHIPLETLLERLGNALVWRRSH